MNIALLLGLDFFEGALVAFLYFAGADRPYLGELEQEAKITIIKKIDRPVLAIYLPQRFVQYNTHTCCKI